jgi:O-antigen/teichoic acid export membrane protein
MNLLRASAVYASANIAAAAVPFLLLPILTRLLGPEEYGHVVSFALLVTFCGSLAGFSVHAFVGVSWFNAPRAELPRLVGTALVLALTSTVGVALLVALLLGVFPSLGAGIAPGWGAAAALTAGFNVILQCRLVLWQSQQRPLPYAWLQVGASVLNIALSLVGVYLLGLGASGRNGGTALSYLVMAALAVWLLFRASEAHMAFDRKQLAPLVRFGLPLMPHALASVLLGTTDRWMVSGDLGPAALGVYGAVAQLGMVMAILADAFAKAFNPWIYAKLSSPTEVEREAAVGAIYTTIPGFLVAGALLAASIYFAAGWLLGNQFQETRRLIPWFVLGGAFNGIYLCCSGIYFFSGRTGRRKSRCPDNTGRCR